MKITTPGIKKPLSRQITVQMKDINLSKNLKKKCYIFLLNFYLWYDLFIYFCCYNNNEFKKKKNIPDFET